MLFLPPNQQRQSTEGNGLTNEVGTLSLLLCSGSSIIVIDITDIYLMTMTLMTYVVDRKQWIAIGVLLLIVIAIIILFFVT